jgi:hypothetical protein
MVAVCEDTEVLLLARNSEELTAIIHVNLVYFITFGIVGLALHYLDLGVH